MYSRPISTNQDINMLKIDNEEKTEDFVPKSTKTDKKPPIQKMIEAKSN